MIRENLFTTPVIVSACLYGCNCRYDGKSKPDERVVAWINSGIRVIFICPEQQGGQPTPRPDAELVGGDGQKMIEDILEKFGKLTPEIIIQESINIRVKETSGNDVTKNFLEGARLALVLAQASGCKVAILKSRSPSCGTETIYDGTFRKKLILGMGVTAAWLQKNGIKTYNEKNYPFLPS
ncbi:MAG: DUF523 domain-containing protein [Candidatus Hodarchaeales archaeon]|jgi:uncharacterized protein YbbK (DUF523 family)